MTKYIFQCVRCRLLCSLECDNCGGLNFEKTEDEFICKNCKENLISATHECVTEKFEHWWSINTKTIPTITYYPKNKDIFFEEQEWVKTSTRFNEDKWVKTFTRFNEEKWVKKEEEKLNKEEEKKEEEKKEEEKKEEEESKKKSWYGWTFYIIFSFMFWLFFFPPSWIMPLHRLIF